MSKTFTLPLCIAVYDNVYAIYGGGELKEFILL